ncbi:alpha/beta hydrolase, partial [Acrocarpospora catenulata]|uniref:alpha/beta hydrolase n=1 Tax=Acrocarpospora catenulata TaxID=2836182 RepID=UPI0027DFF028
MTREDIEFDSCGERLRGWFYPATGARGPAPTVILAGGWCYVRELVMPYYAEAFAAAGVNALVFDYRNLGASGGGDRQHLDPWAQIRDYQSALDYAQTRADVDDDRLGVWGISYSGGHALILGAVDPRVKTIVSQIPVVDG